MRPSTAAGNALLAGFITREPQNSLHGHDHSTSEVRQVQQQCSALSAKIDALQRQLDEASTRIRSLERRPSQAQLREVSGQLASRPNRSELGQAEQQSKDVTWRITSLERDYTLLVQQLSAEIKELELRPLPDELQRATERATAAQASAEYWKLKAERRPMSVAARQGHTLRAKDNAEDLAIRADPEIDDQRALGPRTLAQTTPGLVERPSAYQQKRRKVVYRNGPPQRQDKNHDRSPGLLARDSSNRPLPQSTSFHGPSGGILRPFLPGGDSGYPFIPSFSSFGSRQATTGQGFRGAASYGCQRPSPSLSAAPPGPSTIRRRFDEEIDNDDGAAYQQRPYEYWHDEGNYGSTLEEGYVGHSDADVDADRVRVNSFGLDEDEEDEDQDEVDSAMEAQFQRTMQQIYQSNDAPRVPLPPLRVHANASRNETNTTVRRRRAPVATPPPPVPAKRKGGKIKEVRTLPSLEKFIFTTTGEGLKPLKALPPALADQLSNWLELLLTNEKYFDRACKKLSIANQKEVIDSGVCIARHLMWKIKAHHIPHIEVACKTCCDAAEPRPCVRLMRASTDAAILVFYPRPADRRPADAVWTDAQYWLGVQASV